MLIRNALQEVCRRVSRGLSWQGPRKEHNHDHTSLDSCLRSHRSLKTWVVVAWPLILHCALASTIVAIILRLVDGQEFNLDNRRPSVLLPDGSSNPTSFMLLQSDVTTLLSTALAVLRLVAACWLGPLCWRCAFILLKTVGLTQFQLRTTIRYGVPFIPTRGLKTTCLVVLLVMAVVLPTNIIAPILTGSVTWSTSSRLTERVLNSTVGVSTVATSSGWTGWNRYPAARERLAVSAAGYANIAWARYTPGGWSKRVLRSCSVLGINSTVAAVRIPYFSVDSIEWVTDPEHSLSASQLDVLGSGCSLTTIHDKQQECPIRTAPGTLGLIPGASLTSPSSEGDPFPEPVIIRERRLMVLFSHWREGPQIPCEPVKPANRTNRWISDIFPPNVGFYPQPRGGECWVFAWVNFTAGSGDCLNCRISSYSTVQSDTVLEVQPDRMAGPALRVMPTAISLMTLMNSSIPLPWRNVDKYVTEVLGRSYAVSWAALVDWAGEGDDRLTTEFSPAVQSSRAKVDRGRVFTWLGIQLLITASGVAFIVLQLSLGLPIIDDTTLAAFYLDTTELYRGKNCVETEVGALIKVDYEDGRPKLRVN